MTDPEILDSAPKGATHYECGEYMRNLCDDEWEYWSKAGGWQDTHPESETRSLTDIRRIVELEKERDIRDLEQQAKGLEDLHKLVEKCGAKSLMSFLLIEEADELRAQAKALKEQGE